MDNSHTYLTRVEFRPCHDMLCPQIMVYSGQKDAYFYRRKGLERHGLSFLCQDHVHIGYRTQTDGHR